MAIVMNTSTNLSSIMMVVTVVDTHASAQVTTNVGIAILDVERMSMFLFRLAYRMWQHALGVMHVGCPGVAQ